MNVTFVTGDLLDQPTQAIVNPWNRNIIPWWLLLPHGVSGAIKRRAGTEPFRELGKAGALPLGGAVATSAGTLPFKAIIHVASIDLRWRSNATIIVASVQNTMKVAEARRLRSLAFPILGAGSGGMDTTQAERVMVETFAKISSDVQTVVVRYQAQ